MNLLQAIEQTGDNWFRPTGFESSIFYYHIKDGLIYMNDQPYLDPDIKEITGEWEIVTPEQVIAERAK